MRRIVITFVLLAAMFAGAMSVQAAAEEITVQVRASKTEVQVGETVEYTVLATGSGVVALQFEVKLPVGLRYVPQSGAAPEGLVKKLDVVAVDWTESAMMFTFYNDTSITIAEGTEIFRFSCVAEKAGNWDVKLNELLPFNSAFREFTPTLKVQSVKVIQPAGETKPTEPSVPGEDVPSVTVPENPSQPTVPDHTAGTPTSPTLDQNQDQATDSTINDSTGEIGENVRPGTESTDVPENEALPEQDEQPQEQPQSKLWSMIGLIGGVIIIVGVAVVFLLRKKKTV